MSRTRVTGVDVVEPTDDVHPRGLLELAPDRLVPFVEVGVVPGEDQQRRAEPVESSSDLGKEIEPLPRCVRTEEADGHGALVVSRWRTGALDRVADHRRLVGACDAGIHERDLARLRDRDPHDARTGDPTDQRRG